MTKSRIFVRNQYLSVSGTNANTSITTGPPAYLLRVILSAETTTQADVDNWIVQVGYTTAQLTQALNDQPIIAEFRGRVRQAVVVTAVLNSFFMTQEFGPHGLYIPKSTVISTYYAAVASDLTGRLFLVFQPA